jgi:hypothetical protein
LIDFPDKAYMGGFGWDSGFEARADADGMTFKLVPSSGEKRQVEGHLHHFLFVGILDDLARSVAEREPIDDVHHMPLLEAAQKLATALARVLFRGE